MERSVVDRQGRIRLGSAGQRAGLSPGTPVVIATTITGTLLVVRDDDPSAIEGLVVRPALRERACDLPSDGGIARSEGRPPTRTRRR